MNKFKNLIYKLLYKNTNQQIMDTLTNCEAYKMSTKANDILNKKIQKNTLNLISEIETQINFASSDGEFTAKVFYNSKHNNKENIKYIKQLYKKKGYKVKIFWSIEWSDSNRKMIISWKHWNKK